ncbi:MAG: GyrI-like domain-containing protein [Coriobacteriia bacterium]|nr:GyrI-like domain-containing protein [Coriobacteriia bacterium]
MELLDLRKRYANLYKPGAKVPALVDVPTLRFLMIDGVGDVGGTAFQESMGALFALAYPVKFAAKKAVGISYPVMPPEGVYWSADGGFDLSETPSESMAWRLMIMLPDPVGDDVVEATRAKVAAKKNPPRLSDVRIQSFTEGPSVQIMHIGPYAEETATIERLAAFAAEKGYEFSGAHHEIYYGDPKRVAPEKLKTVVRYPVRRLK